MKVLYISNYRDQSGYSQAARDYISALRAVECPVASRSIKLTPTTAEVSEAVLEAERTPSDGADIVIQHTLPTFFEYDGRFRKNIGLFHLETDRITPNWVRQCNLMDEIWVSCKHNKQSCLDSGVTVPIYVVPIPADTSKYERSYPKLEFRRLIPDDFVFYTVGEFNKRKNLEAIVRAFHNAFRPEEPVQLLIKTSIPGLSGQETIKQLQEFCNAIKSHMGLYPKVDDYKKELCITDHLSQDNLCSLHISSDCFVSASYGEAWCLPAVDALGFGRQVIVPKNTAFLDYFSRLNSYRVGCQKEPCFAATNSVNEIYSSRYNWYNPSIVQISEKMRFVYDNRDERDGLEHLIAETPYKFNYEKVGNLMKEILHNDA